MTDESMFAWLRKNLPVGMMSLDEWLFIFDAHLSASGLLEKTMPASTCWFSSAINRDGAAPFSDQMAKKISRKTQTCREEMVIQLFADH